MPQLQVNQCHTVVGNSVGTEAAEVVLQIKSVKIGESRWDNSSSSEDDTH